MITHTSLTHPTMIARIRQGIKLAALGQGEKMNGHGNRVYIQNSQGHNIMRINWLKEENKILVYGKESRIITHIVIQALQEANK